MVFRDEYCPGHRSVYSSSLDIHILDNYETKYIIISSGVTIELGFPGRSADKESTCNAGNSGSIPGLGGSAGEGIGYPFQYSWASLVELWKSIWSLESDHENGSPEKLLQYGY